MYIVRKEIMEKLLYNIKYKVNTLVVGNKGVGKTALLKYLESFTPNAYYVISAGPKQILTQVLKKASINFKAGEIVPELELKAKKIKNLVLLVDDADKLSKPAKRLLEELNAELILASNTELKTNFDIIKLNGFNDEELRQYLSAKLLPKNLCLKIYNFVKNYSDNSALSINRAIELYSKDLNNGQVYSLFNFSSKRVELFTVASFVSIAYLLMSLRYLFYSRKEFLIGYALSTTAYLLFFLFRRRRN